MGKQRKPANSGGCVPNMDNFEGITFFEELPGTVLSKVSTSDKEPKRKSARDSDIDPIRVPVRRKRPGTTEGQAETRPKRRRKRRDKPVPLGESVTSEGAGECCGDNDGEDETDVDLAEIMEQSSLDLSNWEVLHVPQVLLAGLAQLGYEQPTEIQRLCLPAGIKGRMDIVGAAETGSGKTLAFAIPLMYGVLKEKERQLKQKHNTQEDDADDYRSENGPMALVLVPTRELAIQVKNHIAAVARYTEVKIATVVGGMSEQKQARLLSRKPEIVVATPGRLWEYVEAGDTFFSHLTKIRFLVVDETDRMLEKGHFQQLHLLLERINADPECASRRQNFVFSATLTLSQGPPRRDVRKLAKLSAEQKLKHITAMVGLRTRNRKVMDITRKSGTAQKLTETAIACTIPEKDQFLYYFLLQHPGRTLVFCNSIDCVTRLGHLFTLLEMAPLVLHASMQQRQRLKNLQRFQASATSVLIATDVAARGLDIASVQHVIHYQVPRTSEAYVHRSGRTARADTEGLSVMFIEPSEVPTYRKVLRQLSRDSDLPLFSVDSDVLRSLVPHVTLARDINLAEHRHRREANSKNWRQRAAEEMDLEQEQQPSDDSEVEAESTAERQFQRQVKTSRARLREMLSVRDKIWAPRTSHGRLVVPARNVSALDVAKDSGGSKRKKLAPFSVAAVSQTFPDDPSRVSGVPTPRSDDVLSTTLPRSGEAVTSQQPPAVSEKSSQTNKNKKNRRNLEQPDSAVNTDASDDKNGKKKKLTAKRRKKKRWFARKGGK